MLYVNSRDKAQSYTAHRVLRTYEDDARGYVAPFQLQPFDEETLTVLFSSDFHHSCAAVLNYFFSVNILASDVEFAVGRSCGFCRTMNHKIVVAENWRNPGNSYATFEKSLYAVLTGEKRDEIPHWVRVAIRTSLLFGIYANLYSKDIQTFDLVTDVGDNITLLAAVYGRKLGLPIRMIIVGCDEKSGFWDLIHKAELSTSTSSFCAEPFIFALAGEKETGVFLDAFQRRKTYRPDQEVHQLLSKGIFAAVVSGARIDPIISSIWKTNQYLITPETAVAYSALQDFRAKTGDSCDALLMSDVFPASAGKRMENITGLTIEQIAKHCSLKR